MQCKVPNAPRAKIANEMITKTANSFLSIFYSYFFPQKRSMYVEMYNCAFSLNSISSLWSFQRRIITQWIDNVVYNLLSSLNTRYHCTLNLTIHTETSCCFQFYFILKKKWMHMKFDIAFEIYCLRSTLISIFERE